MRLIWILFALYYTSFAQAKIVEIYNTATKQKLVLPLLMHQLPATGIFIFGEAHNTTDIQQAQAKIITDKVNWENAQWNYTVFWEFLNYTDQTEINIQFDKLRRNEITTLEFIDRTAGEKNHSYAPIIQTTSKNQGLLKAINLPRVIKQKVIKDGIDSVDKKYIPKHHYVGGADYEKRFIAVMRNHIPANKLAAYFLAQCLTDSVMAEQIANNSKKNLNFVIAGSFHTDFRDATIARLEKLALKEIVSFKFVSKNQHTDAELAVLKNGDNEFGAYADYIIISE